MLWIDLTEEAEKKQVQCWKIPKESDEHGQVQGSDGQDWNKELEIPMLCYTAQLSTTVILRKLVTNNTLVPFTFLRQEGTMCNSWGDILGE